MAEPRLFDQSSLQPRLEQAFDFGARQVRLTVERTPDYFPIYYCGRTLIASRRALDGLVREVSRRHDVAHCRSNQRDYHKQLGVDESVVQIRQQTVQSVGSLIRSHIIQTNHPAKLVLIAFKMVSAFASLEGRVKPTRLTRNQAT
ncbi:MAG: hypothetical protein ACXWO3_11275 [Isosphaeraceae bacterium]